MYVCNVRWLVYLFQLFVLFLLLHVFVVKYFNFLYTKYKCICNIPRSVGFLILSDTVPLSQTTENRESLSAVTGIYYPVKYIIVNRIISASIQNLNLSNLLCLLCVDLFLLIKMTRSFYVICFSIEGFHFDIQTRFWHQYLFTKVRNYKPKL